ncbi:MAG: OsmC family protein [Myxococcales bacterium]|nr:OsmC family protein [Myxococcales bacterium]MDH3845384.1 OsmC family protein [Myxococcales bacterium]
MTEHRATIVWNRQGTEFTYKEYTRDHVWKFEGGSEVRASAAPKYLGNDALVDPEQAFVASLSSCHMLTFLALAARDGFLIDNYEDPAVGFMERNDQKKIAITRVVLHPKITWGGEPPNQKQLDELHHQAHEHCFIASSVTTKIEVAPPA